MPIWIAAPGAPPIIKDGDKVKGEKDDKSQKKPNGKGRGGVKR